MAQIEIKTTEDIACIWYIQGVLDTAGQLCYYGNHEEYRKGFAEVDTSTLAALDHFLGSFLSNGSDDTVDAVTQNFVNTAKEAPESWGIIASASILEAAKEIKPCKKKTKVYSFVKALILDFSSVLYHQTSDFFV